MPLEFFIDNVEVFGLPADYLAHFMVGALLFVVFSRKRMPWILAIFLVFLVALGKELWDDSTMQNGSAIAESCKDIFNTVLGAAFAMYFSQWLEPSYPRALRKRRSFRRSIQRWRYAIGAEGN